MKNISQQFKLLFKGGLILLCLFSFTDVKGQDKKEECLLRFITQNEKKSIQCQIKVLDDEDEVILKKRSRDGLFNIFKIKDELDGYCKIEFSEDNKRYWPVNPKELNCPINCNKRILIRKKPKFNEIPVG